MITTARLQETADVITSQVQTTRPLPRLIRNKMSHNVPPFRLLHSNLIFLLFQASVTPTLSSPMFRKYLGSALGCHYVSRGDNSHAVTRYLDLSFKRSQVAPSRPEAAQAKLVGICYPFQSQFCFQDLYLPGQHFILYCRSANKYQFLLPRPIFTMLCFSKRLSWRFWTI